MKVDFSAMKIINLGQIIDAGLVKEYNRWARQENRQAAKDAGNQPADYEKLKPGQQERLQAWISRTFAPAKRAPSNNTSYSLKHWFEASENGFYITNGMFKGAMLAAGYPPTPRTINQINWRFRVRVV